MSTHEREIVAPVDLCRGDGRLAPAAIGWSRGDHLAPWSVRSPGSDRVDLVFTPFHNRSTRTDVGLLANRTDQCFGHYTGSIRTDDGERIAVDRLLGWAEDVRMRW
ncbi:hypothetical protein Snoj_18440 [Streptomyces nojiriensis]|uniref:DUF2804 family protein n=1 Tax=Streptomyces nojiriensis TaxID=66374 RepID=A0ABQ3SIG5_9ACTN|nr:DUF2804 family protein [Streptomyces nojiriensis]QTI49540.1 hypothetical protein JYK04_07412 [Streptomyces nojiriensis]GGS24860.1 hypothetical protein GCM10010205_63610 [Streptomyces nojiriensis]GHI67926.1 hypothetical protein Snoj_18440 [Streptomyces nojiriensis]